MAIIAKTPEQKCLHTDLQKKIVGYLSAFGVSSTGALIIVCGQLIGSSVPATETNLIRFVFQTLFSVAFMGILKVNPKLPLQWKPMCVMGVSILVTFGAGVLFILSSWYLPVAVVQGTMETLVMIMAAIVAIFMKKCTLYLPVAVILCTAGCVLLSQPEFIFHPSSGNNSIICDLVLNSSTANNRSVYSGFNESECGQTEQQGSMATVYGFICVLGLAICLWIHTQFNVNYLVSFTPVISILFWLGIGCSILSLPVMFIFDTPKIIKDPFSIGMVVLLAASFTANNYLIMYSVTLIPFSHVAIILPTAMIYLFIFQRTFLSEIQPGPNNMLEVVGLVMVIIGALIPPSVDIIRERRKITVTDSADDNLKSEQTVQEKTHILDKGQKLENEYGTQL